MADPITGSTDNDRRVTGRDAILKIAGQEVPVSNVSFDREVDTTEVQLNDSLKSTQVTTGLSYSGSFEYDGANVDLESLLFQADNAGRKEKGEPTQLGTLTVTEELSDNTTYGQDGITERTYTFKNVKITSQTRDMPSDDVSSSSFDWVAEDLTVN